MNDKPGKEKDTTLTPMEIINKLGPFDLDPCAYPNHITANYLNIWPSNGLQIHWFGKVWCNPPYSNPGPWLEKLAAHGNGIALVLASTDTKWFQDAAKTCDYILFMCGRPKFLKTDGSKVQLMRATCLIGWGDAGSKIINCGIEGFITMGKWVSK